MALGFNNMTMTFRGEKVGVYHYSAATIGPHLLCCKNEQIGLVSLVKPDLLS